MCSEAMACGEVPPAWERLGQHHAAALQLLKRPPSRPGAVTFSDPRISACTSSRLCTQPYLLNAFRARPPPSMRASLLLLAAASLVLAGAVGAQDDTANSKVGPRRVAGSPSPALT